MSPSAREQILQRARLNNWRAAEYKDAVTVSKEGRTISVRFGKDGHVTRVSTRMAVVAGRGKLEKVLRLMGTVTIE